MRKTAAMITWMVNMLTRKRNIPPFVWFVLANTGICLLLTLSLWLFRLDDWFAVRGIGLQDIWLFVVVISLGGTLTLLLSSQIIVRLFLDAKIVTDSMGTKEQQLNLILHRQSQQAGIKAPQLAIYPSDDLNAFAVGHSSHHAMIVVSRALLDHLSLDELSAVIGHEITHIANGDMLALSLMQGVLNLCVHLPARLVGVVFDQWVLNRPAPGPFYHVTALLLQLFIGGLTSLLVMWFSRQREFRADAGGAMLAGRAEMLAALRCLYAGEKKYRVPQPLTTFGWTGSIFENRILRFFRSHPTLAERIYTLQSDSAVETS